MGCIMYVILMVMVQNHSGLSYYSNEPKFPTYLEANPTASFLFVFVLFCFSTKVPVAFYSH